MNLRSLVTSPITRATVGFLLVAAGLRVVTKVAEEKAAEVEEYDAAIAERVTTLENLAVQVAAAERAAAQLAAQLAARTADAPLVLVDLEALAAYAAEPEQAGAGAELATAPVPWAAGFIDNRGRALDADGAVIASAAGQRINWAMVNDE